MLTGEIRNQIDQIWNDFWSGGVSNPLSVIEQITYLLFIKRLDDLHTLEESKAATLGMPMERRISRRVRTSAARPYDDMRWSRFKNFEPREMFDRGRRARLPLPAHLWRRGIELRRAHEGRASGLPQRRRCSPRPSTCSTRSPMDDRDTKGDLYEYMLGKIATAGQNGQFRTPRHIIQLMVELIEPTPDDVICDPAAGTCGFLVAAGEYLREHHPELFRDDEAAQAFPRRDVPRLRLRRHHAAHRRR